MFDRTIEIITVHVDRINRISRLRKPAPEEEEKTPFFQDETDFFLEDGVHRCSTCKQQIDPVEVDASMCVSCDNLIRIPAYVR